MVRPQTCQAENTTDHGVPIVRLKDPSHAVEVLIVPSFGNRAYELNVQGKNILYMPAANLEDLIANPVMCGIPFLAPWANRLDQEGFRVNGRSYTFNFGLGVLHQDSNGMAIHGMLMESPFWFVTAVEANAFSASVTSRLEFWKHPALMANWPFAHEYEMTYRLSEGRLEIITSVVNCGGEPMPISVGFHPYFVLPDFPRDEAMVHLPVGAEVIVDERLVPTGAMHRVEPERETALSSQTFDQGYTDLIRGENGQATFYIAGGGRKIEVSFGPKWQVAIVYAPAGRDFICFEPMAAVTNAINLAAGGKYPALQMLQPGSSWTESFRVDCSGLA